MRTINLKETFWISVFTILCIACFPLNPLVLTGLLETSSFLPLSVLGWISWAIGMALIISPMLMFPRRGNVPKGKSFVHTTRIVDSGIYGIVRHPQYLGGILAVFIATPLLYPHWLFIVLGIPGIVIVYRSTWWEEKRLVERFGIEYQKYKQKVPRMNLILGIIRLGKRQKAV